MRVFEVERIAHLNGEVTETDVFREFEINSAWLKE